MNTPEMEALRAFRYQVYTKLACRRDAHFEIMEAVLTAPVIDSPAHVILNHEGDDIKDEAAERHHG